MDGKTPSPRRCEDKRIYLLRSPGKGLENERKEEKTLQKSNQEVIRDFSEQDRRK